MSQGCQPDKHALNYAGALCARRIVRTDAHPGLTEDRARHQIAIEVISDEADDRVARDPEPSTGEPSP